MTRSSKGARMLARECYASSQHFELEQERIFFDAWLYAGHISQVQVPGQFFLFDHGRQQAIVVRGRDGEIRAFFNVCRHRASVLCQETEGKIEGKLRCPYHSWTYELDGSLSHAPSMEDVSGFEKEQHGLVPVAVGVLEGLIFVNFSSAPKSFKETFAALAGKFDRYTVGALESAGKVRYEVKANWKLLFQNYSECYHCPGVHPQLNRLTPYRDTWNDLEEGPFLGGPMRMREAVESMTMTGLRCADPLPLLGAQDHQLVYYYTIFPSFFLSLHPDYVLIHRIEPKGPSETVVTCDWLFHKDAVHRADFDPASAIEFWETTNQQDWELCEISQRGIESRGYRPGPYSELESQLAAFDREYLRVMAAGGC